MSFSLHSIMQFFWVGIIYILNFTGFLPQTPHEPNKGFYYSSCINKEVSMQGVYTRSEPESKCKTFFFPFLKLRIEIEHTHRKAYVSLSVQLDTLAWLNPPMESAFRSKNTLEALLVFASSHSPSNSLGWCFLSGARFAPQETFIKVWRYFWSWQLRRGGVTVI